MRGRIAYLHEGDDDYEDAYDVLFDDGRYERSCQEIRILILDDVVVNSDQESLPIDVKVNEGGTLRR